MNHDQHVIDWMRHSVHGATMQYLHPAYRDNRNCTVRALRDALGIHLIDAYVRMREQGRKHGRGVYPADTARYYRNIAGQLGYQYSQLANIDAWRDYGKTIVTAQRALPTTTGPPPTPPHPWRVQRSRSVLQKK